MQKINPITNNGMLESDATHKEERYATATPALQKTPNPGHTKYASRRKLGKPTNNQPKSQPTRNRSLAPPGQFGTNVGDTIVTGARFTVPARFTNAESESTKKHLPRLQPRISSTKKNQ